MLTHAKCQQLTSEPVLPAVLTIVIVAVLALCSLPKFDWHLISRPLMTASLPPTAPQAWERAPGTRR